jgi:hypothetical protein
MSGCSTCLPPPVNVSTQGRAGNGVFPTVSKIANLAGPVQGQPTKTTDNSTQGDLDKRGVTQSQLTLPASSFTATRDNSEQGDLGKVGVTQSEVTSYPIHEKNVVGA